MCVVFWLKDVLFFIFVGILCFLWAEVKQCIVFADSVWAEFKDEIIEAVVKAEGYAEEQPVSTSPWSLWETCSLCWYVDFIWHICKWNSVNEIMCHFLQRHAINPAASNCIETFWELTKLEANGLVYLMLTVFTNLCQCYFS